MIRIMIVDDSPVARQLLQYIFDNEADMEVIASVADGRCAVNVAGQVRPDVITMDVNMPEMNGFTATRKIMESCPTRIVVVTGQWDPKGAATTFGALEAGALAVVARPPGIGHPCHEELKSQLVQTVRSMSEVQVVRRWPRAKETVSILPDLPRLEAMETSPRIVAMGASTGGPLALQTILKGLPPDYPLPVVIVQHMAVGFIRGFVEWLAQTSDKSVEIAAHGAQVQAGKYYIAPDGFHLELHKDGRLLLARQDSEKGLCPSVSHLFRSVADSYGKRAVGVLLTGMGKDGAEELKLMKDLGAVTIAQDTESSIVHGMPGAAIRIDGATYVLPPQRIVDALQRLVAS